MVERAVVYQLQSCTSTEWRDYAVPLRCRHGPAFHVVIARSATDAYRAAVFLSAVHHAAYLPPEDACSNLHEED